MHMVRLAYGLGRLLIDSLITWVPLTQLGVSSSLRACEKRPGPVSEIGKARWPQFEPLGVPSLRSTADTRPDLHPDPKTSPPRGSACLACKVLGREGAYFYTAHVLVGYSTHQVSSQPPSPLDLRGVCTPDGRTVKPSQRVAKLARQQPL